MAKRTARQSSRTAPKKKHQLLNAYLWANCPLAICGLMLTRVVVDKQSGEDALYEYAAQLQGTRNIYCETGSDADAPNVMQFIRRANKSLYLAGNREIELDAVTFATLKRRPPPGPLPKPMRVMEVEPKRRPPFDEAAFRGEGDNTMP